MLLRGVLVGAPRWRQINSENEEGADAAAQKRRVGDTTVWGSSIEQAMRQKYIEATRNLKADSKRRKGALVLS